MACLVGGWMVCCVFPSRINAVGVCCCWVFFKIYPLGCYLIWVFKKAVILEFPGWSLRLRPRATGLDWFSFRDKQGITNQGKVLPEWGLRKQIGFWKCQFCPGQWETKRKPTKCLGNPGVSCKGIMRKERKWSCAQCTSDIDFIPSLFLNFPTFSFFNPRLCWRKHSPQGLADLSDCLQHPSGAYHHIFLLQVTKEYFGSLLMFLPTFIFL